MTSDSDEPEYDMTVARTRANFSRVIIDELLPIQDGGSEEQIGDLIGDQDAEGRGYVQVSVESFNLKSGLALSKMYETYANRVCEQKIEYLGGALADQDNSKV